MPELLWLLLPVAAATGWWSGLRYAHRTARNRSSGFRDDYLKGLNYLLNEQPDKALELFMRMVEVDSETVGTHLLLGSLFRKRGEVERAIRIHQNLIARPHLDGRHRATALLELGKDYMHAGLLDRAEGLYKELLGTGHLRAEANRELQRIYEQEKDWANAIRYAEASQIASGEPGRALLVRIRGKPASSGAAATCLGACQAGSVARRSERTRRNSAGRSRAGGARYASCRQVLHAGDGAGPGVSAGGFPEVERGLPLVRESSRFHAVVDAAQLP